MERQLLRLGHQHHPSLRRDSLGPCSVIAEQPDDLRAVRSERRDGGHAQLPALVLRAESLLPARLPGDGRRLPRRLLDERVQLHLPVPVERLHVGRVVAHGVRPGWLVAPRAVPGVDRARDHGLRERPVQRGSLRRRPQPHGDRPGHDAADDDGHRRRQRRAGTGPPSPSASRPRTTPAAPASPPREYSLDGAAWTAARASPSRRPPTTPAMGSTPSSTAPPTRPATSRRRSRSRSASTPASRPRRRPTPPPATRGSTATLKYKVVDVGRQRRQGDGDHQGQEPRRQGREDAGPLQGSRPSTTLLAATFTVPRTWRAGAYHFSVSPRTGRATLRRRRRASTVFP